MKIRFFLLFLIIFGVGFNETFAQKFCGVPQPTDAEKQALLADYQAFTKNLSSQKSLRQGVYQVAVRANIVYADNSKTGLTEADVRAIITHANTYLSNANIQLYLLRDSVKTIINAKWADFHFADENDLRAKNDVLNAINIYFLQNMTLTDLSELNGYTNFPSLAAAGNRIFYTYNNRTTDDYNHLYNKLFLHEIGHYFGLLHTFQDSGNSNVSLRELVTRGAGSNCSSTGDQLCDTPADPYELLPAISAYGCSEDLPKDLKDANGDTFTPPVDNIMSYNFNCGNVFTPQQYQKMQAAFAVRFSPAAEYSIIAQSPNSVGVVQFDKKVYCVGDSMRITFSTTGLFDANNTYFVDISDATGNNYTRINNNRKGNQLSIKVPNFPDGDDYRVQITASRPSTVSPNSENFSIRTPPTAILTTQNSTISRGDSAQLLVNFTGSGTWTFQLSDGTYVQNTRLNPYPIYRKPIQSTSYSLLFTENMCGYGSTTGTANVAVIDPQITGVAFSGTNFCVGQSITLTISTAGKFPANNQFFVLFSDKTLKSFVNLPTQTVGNVLTAQLPSNVTLGTGYRIKVATSNPYTEILPPDVITFVNPPQPPTTSPISFCQNSTASSLTANGKNLKWYLSQTDTQGNATITPPTTNEGSLIYYVSQSDPPGCESKRTPLEVSIKPLATATISGDQTIYKGDSTRINFAFTGDSPYSFTLSNNKLYATTTKSYYLSVNPSLSTTYTLQSIKNDCGFGKIFGSAKITVLEPLSVESEEKSVNVYPNPVRDKLVVSLNLNPHETASLFLMDASGKDFYEKKVTGTGTPAGTPQQETIDFQGFTGGIYYLKVDLPKGTVMKKIFKQ